MATEPEIQELRSQLMSANDPYEQLEASYELAKRGSLEGRDLFIQSLQNPDPEVRLEAAGLLGQIGPSWAIAPVGELLNDPKSYLRNEAIFALMNIGRAGVVPWLIKALADQDDERREDARVALATLLGDEIPISSGTDETGEQETGRVAMWWDSAKARFQSDLCYYNGRVSSLSEWIASLKNASPVHFDWVTQRLHWYTGVDFGTDPAETVAAKWALWWRDHSATYEVGCRYFYGHSVNGEEAIN